MALYWITQAGAINSPGTAFLDPKYANIPAVQPILVTILLGLLSVAYFLENRWLKAQAAQQVAQKIEAWK